MTREEETDENAKKIQEKSMQEKGKLLLVCVLDLADRETETGKRKKRINQNSLKVIKEDKNAGENTEKDMQEKGKLLLVCSILQTGRQRRGNRNGARHETSAA